MTKLVRVSQFAVALTFFLFFVGSLRQSRLAAQNDPRAASESAVSLQVAAVDEIAAADVAEHHIHVHPQHSASRARFSPAENELSRPMNSSRGSAPDSDSGVSRASVPSLTGPAFYPADLSDPLAGRVLTSVQSNNLYVNCAASCWGNPSSFLTLLASSNFIHITDQYVGSTANNRYTVGAASSIDNSALPSKLTNYDILQIVHAGARLHGSGYGHVYHVFLRGGVDVCILANVCYSPDNRPTFAFCAYHGSATFKDIGHVLYTVEPFQNVKGCAVMQPSPNGALVDSTSSTLSHELIETITDPDGTAWFAQNSLLEYGAEIGDICETPFGNYVAFTVSGKPYGIQPEYSNKYHACATTP
jgi:hypothetical protein